MYKNKKLKPVYTILLLLLVLVASVAALSGCMAQGAVAGGWSGGVVADGVLYTGSMTGKLASVETATGSLIKAIPLETAQPSSGFLSCAQGGSSVVILYGTPVIADDLVCIGGNNGKVYAFPREETREEPRWIYPRQGNVGGSIIGSIVYDNGKLYFGAANDLVFCLDAADGFKEWETDIGDMIWSTPAVSDGTLYIGSFNKKLIALDTEDGRKKWEFETEGAIVSTPVIDGDTIYIGSFDRYVYAVNAETGTLKWKFLADNWFWAEPTIIGNILYAPCLDGKVYALDTLDGRKIAEYNLESAISSSPVVVNDSLIVGTQDGLIYRIDGNNTDVKVLNVLGEDEKIYANLIAGEDKVYVHSSANILYEIDAGGGAKREIIIEIPTKDNEE